MKNIAFVLAMVSSLGISASRAVLIADFDTGAKPNNVGGDFGAWEKDPADKTQYCREGFDNVNTRTGTGYSERLSYDVDSPNPAFNGFWMKLGNLDASKAKKLIFWAKGDDKKGCTARVKVEIKTASEKGTFYADGISAKWTKIEVPLAAFNISDLSALTEMTVVFEDSTSTPKEGVIYLDDIAVE